MTIYITKILGGLLFSMLVGILAASFIEISKNEDSKFVGSSFFMKLTAVMGIPISTFCLYLVYIQINKNGFNSIFLALFFGFLFILSIDLLFQTFRKIEYNKQEIVFTLFIWKRRILVNEFIEASYQKRLSRYKLVFLNNKFTLSNHLNGVEKFIK